MCDEKLQTEYYTVSTERIYQHRKGLNDIRF